MIKPTQDITIISRWIYLKRTAVRSCNGNSYIYEKDASDNQYYYWQASSFKTSTPATVKSWWGKNRCLTNTFPDGRYVTATWTGMGGGLAELWYNVYNKDGTLSATGPTGYSAQFGSSYELLAFAVNNSKFVVCLADIGKSFLEEYYRVAVVQESDKRHSQGTRRTNTYKKGRIFKFLRRLCVIYRQRRLHRTGNV